jgi:16S rRNA (guanine966-N2)-methyltransferase
MRISAGDLKGRVLALPQGSRARPATGFAAEMAMNLFTPWRLAGGVFLDVCAGSGLMGFEALSRGAPRAIFVESDERHAKAIIESALRFGVKARCWVLTRDARRCAGKVEEVLAGWGGAEAGALISSAFLDPPYIPGMAFDVLSSFWAGCGRLGGASIFAPDALLILRTPDRNLPTPPGLRLLEARKAGNGRMWLFQPEE